MANERYRAETGCAALADQRGDSLVATAPPAQRWLLIESRTHWPRHALTALRRSTDLAHQPASSAAKPAGALESSADAGPKSGPNPAAAPNARPGAGEELGVEVARRCRELGYRPVLIKRYGRVDRSVPRRWAVVDCRPGRESIRWGLLPSDEHVLEVLSGADRGVVSHEPIYLVCTHGRHDACCAVRGRPVAAALVAAYPDRTWECSHVGGDRFAANVVVLPHGLFYGHVPATRAVELAKQYDEGFVVPDLLRGSGAFSPPVQAAQHFARAAGHSLAVNALHPAAIRRLRTNRWQIDLATHTAHDPDHPTQPPAHPTRQPGQASRQPERAEEPSGQTTRQPGQVTVTGQQAAQSVGRETWLAGQATTGSGQVAGVGGEVERSAVITVEVSAWVDTVDARLTCASAAPGHVRRFRFNSLTTN